MIIASSDCPTLTVIVGCSVPEGSWLITELIFALTSVIARLES